MTELENLVPRTTCPYCKDEFETERKQALHRSKCSEAAYQSQGNIPNNPDVGENRANKVNDYRRNNNRRGSNGEETGEPQGSTPEEGDPQ